MSKPVPGVEIGSRFERIGKPGLARIVVESCTDLTVSAKGLTYTFPYPHGHSVGDKVTVKTATAKPVKVTQAIPRSQAKAAVRNNQRQQTGRFVWP